MVDILKNLLVAFFLLIGFSIECFTTQISDLIEIKNIDSHISLSIVWDELLRHCMIHQFRDDEDVLERRYIDWNRGLDGEADMSSRCDCDPSKWNDIDAPEILRPFFLKILEATEEFRHKNDDPSSFLWMLRKQSKGNGLPLEFHRDDNSSNNQPVTALLYDTKGVLSGGELIFATENGEGAFIDTPDLYINEKWLGDNPSVEEVVGSLRHLLTYQPKTGDLVTFANMKLFHALNEFKLRPNGVRILLTLFFIGMEAKP